MHHQVYRSTKIYISPLENTVFMCFLRISEQATIISLYLTEFCTRHGVFTARSELYILIKLRLVFQGLFIYKNKYPNMVQDTAAVFIDTTMYSSSSSVGATARCGLWPVEQYLSICPYLPPTLSIFSLPALEDLFPLLLSIFSWVFLFVSSLRVLE